MKKTILLILFLCFNIFSEYQLLGLFMAGSGVCGYGEASEVSIDSISPLKVKPGYTIKYYFTGQQDSTGNEVLAINSVSLPIVKFSGGEGWATIYGAPRGTYTSPRFGTFSGSDTTWVDTAGTPVKNYIPEGLEGR